MDRQSFVANGAHQYNGARPALSEWFATPQGRYVLDWEMTQFDHATEDVFGYRAVQIGLHQLDFLRANRIPFASRWRWSRRHAGRADRCRSPARAWTWWCCRMRWNPPPTRTWCCRSRARADARSVSW
jgi:hypothetical protein